MIRFNLNSYFAMDAILNAPTLTEAARTVHLSQPAMSLSLKKLRELFGDELVSYEHGRAEFTDLAEQLRPQVREILRLSRAVLDQSRTFDPTEATRTFRIAAPEYVLSFLMPPLAAHLLLEAPGISLEWVRFPLASGEDTRIDLYVVPEGMATTGEPSQLLLTEPIGCVSGAGGGIGTGDIDTESYLSMDHIAMADSQDAIFWPADHPARKLLRRRKVVAEANDLEVLKQVVIERGLIVTTFMRLAQQLAVYSPLIVARGAPKAFSPVRIVMHSATGRSHEPAIQWLTQQVKLVVKRKIVGTLAQAAEK